MNLPVILLGMSLVICLIAIIFLASKLIRVKEQLSIIQEALEDIKNGNLNRRVIARKDDMTKDMCFSINDIAINYQSKIVEQKQAEQAYKRLMTSLSHDVKTPLASLVGYLEAVDKGIVHGAEKQEYLSVSLKKSYELKDFIEKLFEWVKLDAKEQVFYFEKLDIHELSRSIFADWINILENNEIDYKINIPENSCELHIDQNAYTRILNNILQNVLLHSKATLLTFSIENSKNSIKIIITDNGAGITDSELPHIFERMYQCDKSRQTNGNGLGLAIAKDLVAAHQGEISATSTLGKGTIFYITVPKKAD